MANVWPLKGSQVGAIPIGFSFTPRDHGAWYKKDAPDLEYRDLGLKGASGGVLDAEHVRVAFGGPDAEQGWKINKHAFLFFIVRKGTLKLEVEGGPSEELSPLDCVYLPLGARFRYTPSHDFEANVFRAPASPDGVPADVAKPNGKAIVNKEVLENYTVAAGPRQFFTYRNLEIAEITGRRIHIHVIRAANQREGGTGWHTHNMSQWFMVLQGTGAITVEGGGDVTLRAGDCMTLGAHIRHNQTAYSPDYIEIEICIPADYTTDPDRKPDVMPPKMGWTIPS